MNKLILVFAAVVCVSLHNTSSFAQANSCQKYNQRCIWGDWNPAWRQFIPTAVAAARAIEAGRSPVAEIKQLVQAPRILPPSVPRPAECLELIVGAQSTLSQHDLAGAHRIAEEAVDCYEGASIGAPRPSPAPRHAHFDITIAAVGWISPTPDPFWQVPASTGFNAVAYEPHWIFKVYMGLMGTSNVAPPRALLDPDRNSLLASYEFRSLNYAKIRVTVNPETLEPIGPVEIVGEIQDPGWTRPFKMEKFPPESLFLLSQGNKNVADPIPRRGQLNPISAIQAGLHPNNGIKLSRSETVLASGLIKFRAGDHTDKIGIIDGGSPWHVPWVWNEFVLAYDNKHYLVHLTATDSQLHGGT